MPTTNKVKFFYTVHSGGDGSASVQFHPDEKSAQIACDNEEEGGEAFGDNYPNAITLEFDKKGKLLNPSITMAELLRERAEIRGEEVEEETSPKKQFAAAAKTEGRTTVAFTGKLSTMTRAEAATDAEEKGYSFSRYVTAKTDYLVVGENSGSKLDKAKARGVTILTESEWRDLLSPKAAPATAFNVSAPKEDDRQTVVFTGKLYDMTRTQISEAIEREGVLRISDKVTPKTVFVVAGKNASKDKLEKAKALGITVYDDTTVSGSNDWRRKTSDIQQKAKAPKPRN